MKIASFRLQEHEGKEVLAINIEAENQAETALLIHVSNRFPSSIVSYGKVSPSLTWAWIMLPLNKSQYGKDYFGNTK